MWHKKWWGVLLIIIIALVLIILVAFGFYIFDAVKRIKKSELEGQILDSRLRGNDMEKQKNAEGGGNNYWLGATNPKITIVEFFDFVCPYCKNSFPKIREIGVKYKDNVKIIVRDYPLHENSLDLAMAGRCAGEQGLFWLMYDKLFANQGITGKEQLTEMANQIGANVGRFVDCFDQQKYITAIRKDFADGESLEITGTPTWFVNGYKIEGDVPIETWEEIINKFLISNFQFLNNF